MNVFQKQNWTAEDLRELQSRGRFFYEMFPGANRSEEPKDRKDPNQTTDTKSQSQSGGSGV